MITNNLKSSYRIFFDFKRKCENVRINKYFSNQSLKMELRVSYGPRTDIIIKIRFFFVPLGSF